MAPELDARILGKLLLMQSTMHVMPDEANLSAFINRGLSEIPEIGVTGICLRGKRYFDELDKALPGAKSLSDCSECASAWRVSPTPSGFACGLEKIKGGSVLEIRTAASFFGFFIIKKAEDDSFSRYKPYLENTANLMALIIENKLQSFELTAHRTHLEQEVVARTQKLKDEIEERKKIEKRLIAREAELAERNQFIETLVNLSPDILYIYDLAEQKNIYSNEGVQNILGFTTEEIIELGDQLIPSLMHPDDFEIYLQTTIPQYLKAIDGERIRHQYRMKDKSGAWHWLESDEVIYQRMPDGSPRQIFGVIHDITARKLSETALVESEQRYRNLFNQANEGLLMMTPEGKLIEVNQAFADMHGYTPEELKTMDIRDLDVLKAETMKEHAETIKKMNTGETVRFEAEHYHKDGHIFPVSVTTSIIHIEDQPYFFGFHQDITERKQMDEQLRHSEKMQAIGQLAGGIAHDFNNQLAGILNFAEIVKALSTGNPEAASFLDKIITMVNRSAGLTRQLLAYSRKGKYQVAEVDLHVLISEVVSILERSIDKKISLRRLLRANPSTTSGDISQLQNAILNLALNARDAMEQGGELNITTANRSLTSQDFKDSEFDIPPGEYIALSISDTGKGMDDQVRSRMFEPFFTTKALGQGTGMGLAAVYGTIMNHHGAISVESMPGRGTTMTMYLPLSRKTAEPESKTPDAVFSPQVVRILFVDDEEMMCMAADFILNGAGHKVTLRHNGREAVAFYADHWQEVDLVILDMLMPEMNGKEAFLEMKALNPNIKALMLSGYSMQDEARNALELGMLGFVEKPYTREQLLEKISQVLSQA